MNRGTNSIPHSVYLSFSLTFSDSVSFSLSLSLCSLPPTLFPSLTAPASFLLSLCSSLFPVLPFFFSSFQVDDNAEALDAAAVEAALSLCEEAADSHALPGPWEPGPFRPPQSGPASASCGLDLKQELMVEKGVARGSAPLVSGPTQIHPRPAPAPSSSSSLCLDHAHAPGPRLGPSLQGGASREEAGREGSPASSHLSIKCESEEWAGVDTPHTGV